MNRGVRSIVRELLLHRSVEWRTLRLWHERGELTSG
jgi:hypothetical protein